MSQAYNNNAYTNNPPYYTNQPHQSSSSPPPPPPPPPQNDPSLPPHIRRHYHSEYNRYYYENTQTGLTTWAHPSSQEHQQQQQHHQQQHRPTSYPYANSVPNIQQQWVNNGPYPPSNQHPSHQPPPFPQHSGPYNPAPNYFSQNQPPYDYNNPPATSNGYPSNFPGSSQQYQPHPHSHSHPQPHPQQPQPQPQPLAQPSFQPQPDPNHHNTAFPHMDTSFVNVQSNSSFLNNAYGITPERLNASQISLELRAIGLKNKDLVSKSDPLCFIRIPKQQTIETDSKTKWETIGRTEVLRNTLSPTWTTRIRLPYLFEQYQPLQFYLIDVDNFKKNTGKQLGKCETSLDSIVRNGSLTLDLTTAKGTTGNFGKLIVRSHDEHAHGKVRLDLTLAGKKLKNVEFMGVSDPFFRIKCTLPGSGASSLLCTSEVVKNNLNPVWQPKRIVVPTAGQPKENVQLTITVYDWNNTLAHKTIGETTTSLAQLIQAPSLELKSHNHRRKTGDIIISKADLIEMPSFISYIQGGLKMNFVVAVDFTASNKPVHMPESLHYNGDINRPSVYANALNAVGTVIKGYTHDETMSALGFGAKLPGHTQAAFDFVLSGNADPRVQGVDGLLAAYKQAASSVKLSGPTLFTPLIRNVIGRCKENEVTQQNQSFTVLLIITDGVITDFDDTVDAIIDASFTAPMSIVIVGVGTADFTAMKALDSDEQILQSRNGNKKAKYDIVQFVKYDDSQSLASLAANVLHEVPQQLVDYMVDARIVPNAPAT